MTPRRPWPGKPDCLAHRCGCSILTALASLGGGMSSWRAIAISTAVIVGIYSLIGLVTGGLGSDFFDPLPFYPVAGLALLFSAIVFSPGELTGRARGGDSDDADRLVAPELLAFLAFRSDVSEAAAARHLSAAGLAALAARLIDTVGQTYPARLVLPDDWDAGSLGFSRSRPLTLLEPGLHNASSRAVLRTRATLALRRGGVPSELADRLREDDAAWQYGDLGDVIALLRIHSECALYLGKQVAPSSPDLSVEPDSAPPASGGAAQPQSPKNDPAGETKPHIVSSSVGAEVTSNAPNEIAVAVAFMIPKSTGAVYPGGIEPEIRHYVREQVSQYLERDDLELAMLFPQDWPGPPVDDAQHLIDPEGRMEYSEHIVAALDARDCGLLVPVRFGVAEQHCVDLGPTGHLLLFAVVESVREEFGDLLAG